MGIVIDLIIIAILALSIFIGYKKGLINVAMKLVATIIAIIVTACLYVPVSNLIINATNVDETIENTIYTKVTETIRKENETQQKDKNDIKSLEGKLVEDAKNNILPQTARNLAINIVNIAVMIILFLGIKFGIKFITSLANAIAKLPIIKQFNKAGGILYGALMGLIIIFVALEIIKFIAEINPQASINSDIQKSFIGSMLYNNNVIEIFLK